SSASERGDGSRRTAARSPPSASWSTRSATRCSCWWRWSPCWARSPRSRGQTYSRAYLVAERPGPLGRYYTYQSLFAFSMLGLVLAPGFLQMFVFWELVGLCSYLLIGYWYERPAAARAAVKAFWITKLGDVGFIIGIVLLWSATGTFEFTELFEKAQAVSGLPLIMFLIYLGAVGKSAQFPLHVWLPDAMEG